MFATYATMSAKSFLVMSRTDQSCRAIGIFFMGERRKSKTVQVFASRLRVSIKPRKDAGIRVVGGACGPKGAGPKGPSLLSEAAYNGNAGIGGCGTLGGRV